MDGCQVEWRFPASVEVSRRGDDRVFWAPQRRVAVKVDPIEAQVLEACRNSGSLEEVIRATAQHYGLACEAVRPGVRRILDRLLETGFLDREGSGLGPEPRVNDSPFRPVILYLHMSGRCNLRCSYCYNEEHRAQERSSQPLKLEEYRTLLSKASAAGVRTIVFTGGEALLSRIWLQVAEHARELGMGLTLLTNGTRIASRNASDIARLFHSVIVSLDSPDPAVNDLQRGPHAFDRTLAGIEALRATDYRGLILRPVITRYNLHTLRHFPAFAKEKCGTTRFSPILYIPNSLQESERLKFSPLPREVCTAFDEFRDSMTLIGGEMVDVDDALRGRVRCGAGATILSIEFNGDIYPCQALHDPRMRLGNVRNDDPFATAERAPASREMRSLHVDNVETCATCNFKAICGGGCRAVAWKLHGRLTAFVPELCEYNRIQAWNAIWAQFDH
jgi:radical SAM protein with 4Fe4S-binding SPASM domain